MRHSLHHRNPEQTLPAGIEPNQPKHNGGALMGRYLLLWMLGIPLPILVLIYVRRVALKVCDARNGAPISTV
jgi:hypothetical protein